MANPSHEAESVPPDHRPDRRRRRWLAFGGVIVVVAAFVVGGIWWYLRDDAPAQVDLGTATRSVTTVPGQKNVSLTGTWKVDSSTGSFDFSSATGTFAGFRVSEDLSGVGSTTAVGRTGSVSGSMRIADGSVTTATFDVDVTTIVTDRSRRNRRVQDALDTSRYPTATFVLADPIRLPADAASGQQISVDAHGKLTIHGVTRSVVVPLKAQLKGDTIVVVGSTDVRFSDYGVQAPRAPVVLSVDDHGTMEFQLLLTKG